MNVRGKGKSTAQKLFQTVLVHLKGSPIYPVLCEIDEKQFTMFIQRAAFIGGLSAINVGNGFLVNLIANKSSSIYARGNFDEISEFAISINRIQREALRDFAFGYLGDDTHTKALIARNTVRILQEQDSYDKNLIYTLRRHKDVSKVGGIDGGVLLKAEKEIEDIIGICQKFGVLPIEEKIRYNNIDIDALMVAYIKAALKKEKRIFNAISDMKDEDVLKIIRVCTFASGYRTKNLLGSYLLSLAILSKKESMTKKVNDIKNKRKENRFLRPSQRIFFESILTGGWHDTKRDYFAMENCVSRMKEKKNQNIFTSPSSFQAWVRRCKENGTIVEPSLADKNRQTRFADIVSYARSDIGKIAYYYNKIINGKQIQKKQRGKKNAR